MKSKRYYAASHYLGNNFSYDSDGWSVFVFETKEKRENFVLERPQHRESIDRNTARKIVGNNVKEVWHTEECGILEPSNQYYNSRYFG